MEHADPKTLQITLPADQIERLDGWVESGEYRSRDEVVREALLLWEEREALNVMDDAQLKAEYEAGLASGDPVAIDIDELIERFKASRHAEG
jgi:antitoxin ParD1/3/4